MSLCLDSQELSPEEALKWFWGQKQKTHPHYFLSHWKTGKSFFCAHQSLFAFQKTRKHLVLAGEPSVGEGGDLAKAYKAFLAFAHKLNKRLCGYYIGESLLSGEVEKLCLGTSQRIDLLNYNLNSSKAKEVRRALRKSEQSSYKVVSDERVDSKKVLNLIKKWRAKKLPVALKFLLSEPLVESAISTAERKFAIEKDGDYFAYCSVLPYEVGGRAAMYIDSLVYDPKKESFALTCLISQLILTFKSAGFAELHLGLSPFAKIEAKHWTEKTFKSFYKFPFFYKPAGLHFFKKKFYCEEKPEFCFVESGQSKGFAMLDMMKVTLI